MKQFVFSGKYFWGLLLWDQIGNLVNIGWGNGLVLYGDKPLPESLTHWGWGKMAITLADDILICNFIHENILILIKN